MAATPALVKRPGETRKYAVNFGNQPELRDGGDTLASPSVTATPSGLTFGTPAIDGARIRFGVSGGVDATDYDILCSVNTSSGAHLEETVTLKVRVKGTA